MTELIPDPPHTPEAPPPPAPKHAALLVEYDGAGFCGWARQPDAYSVEEAIRDAFAATHADLIDLRCAGRTDSGVHASHQVVSVHYAEGPPPERLPRALSSLLPEGVAVRRSAPCAPDFDARAHARSRAYEYRVLPSRTSSPLRRHHVLFHPRTLDHELLISLAPQVVGQHDFTAFTPSDTKHVYFHRTVLESEWIRRGDELVYCIRAKAFLRHMVRVIVGTMLAIGRHEVEPDLLAHLLAGAPRSDARQTALPHGLCLVDAEYDPPLFAD